MKEEKMKNSPVTMGRVIVAIQRRLQMIGFYTPPVVAWCAMLHTPHVSSNGPGQVISDTCIAFSFAQCSYNFLCFEVSISHLVFLQPVFENFKIFKFVWGSNLFRYQNFKIFKFVHILNVFIYLICLDFKFVWIFNFVQILKSNIVLFEKSRFKICSYFKKMISNLFLFEICSNF
jgi:hypothetical protein